MLYEQDQILVEKWMQEERERRIREEGKKIVETSKGKRNIEGMANFGNVEMTEDSQKLMKNTVDSSMVPG